ncbi:MAG: VWA domain-containing protein [Desulfobulbaceae bacterium]|nr:VWA domain-containing protein [Desulfobulbaceae bacterium]
MPALGVIRGRQNVLFTDSHAIKNNTHRHKLYDTNKPASTESYATIVENRFKAVTDAPLSTFSIDVDTASYSNMRRFLRNSQMPPVDSVRIEEMINYFPYDYSTPVDGKPFAVNAEVCQCPWENKHQLMRIGIKGMEMPAANLPPSNLVFLLDVSGSMNSANKLPLLKKAFGMLVRELGGKDRVAIIVYAGSSGMVLPSTICSDENRQTIIDSLDRLNAGGSTNGGAGIELAYKIASENFIDGGVNRVILATDGDFNVGITGQSDLHSLIETKAKSGVFLTVLGFGMGNYKESTTETLANKGNGNYGYIDTILEAKKILVEQRNSTLITIAKDVKIQIEFNPAQIGAYRLIGYENRMLKAKDFNDDTKDAGEIGAGHTVTALYELVPAGGEIPGKAIDDLKYQPIEKPKPSKAFGNELLTVKLRYKEPDGQKSKLISFPVKQTDRSFGETSNDFKFTCSVASFGMLLRNSPCKGTANFATTLDMAQAGLGEDKGGYRGEFITLIKTAKELAD